MKVGHVRELATYPIKSMAGIFANDAVLERHGIPGDRRFGFRRMEIESDFPWLSASRFPDMILYEITNGHVRAPSGETFVRGSDELNAHMSERYGHPVELMNLKHGIYDDSPISVITSSTIGTICTHANVPADTRRFRPNIVVDTDRSDPFQEDDWIGAHLVFGDDDLAPSVALMLRDERCMMINLDPKTAKQDPAMMKAAVQLNENFAGAYGVVVRTGAINVGQPVYLRRP
jgi:uncharacterized protein YcbX